MYILSDEMRNELLATFRYARDKALKNRDEDSAGYYWGLVDYLQGLPKISSKKELKYRDELDIKIPSVRPMSLKEIEIMLKEDTTLTKHEKFDLYYEEKCRRRKQKKDKEGYSLDEILKLAKNYLKII